MYIFFNYSPAFTLKMRKIKVNLSQVSQKVLGTVPSFILGRYCLCRHRWLRGLRAVSSHSLAGIKPWNLAEDMDASVLLVLCVIR